MMVERNVNQKILEEIAAHPFEGETLLRDMAFLGGSELLFDYKTRRQSALSSIVSLRWPLLKDNLGKRSVRGRDQRGAT